MGLEPSREIEEVARRFIVALGTRDFETCTNLFYRDPLSRYIGTDAHEWWQGSGYIDAFTSHQEEMPDFWFEIQNIEAFAEGPVGWAAVQTGWAFGDDEPRTLRFTFVFVLVDGYWRIAQSHNSFAVANPEVMGVEMTRSVEELLSSLDESVEASIRSVVQQGTVTLMFTDIEDSTVLTAQVGDEKWAATVRWHDETVRAVVEAHQGTVVKTLGDGAMAAFGSVRHGARAAVAIQDAIDQRVESPRIAVRIGLHVGDVILTEDDYLGGTANKAARVMSSAHGGEIVVSSAVLALLEDDPEFQFGDPHRVQLKGFEGSHLVARLTASSAEDR